MRRATRKARDTFVLWTTVKIVAALIVLFVLETHHSLQSLTHRRDRLRLGGLRHRDLVFQAHFGNLE